MTIPTIFLTGWRAIKKIQRRTALAACLFTSTLLIAPMVPPTILREYVHVVQAATKASFYGTPEDGFVGNLMASGKRLTVGMMIAAHPTLPFGTKIRVTNLLNGLSVDVTVMDRGPFVQGRGVDLSYAAAQALDMEDMGIAKVRVSVLSYVTEKLTVGNKA
jgi:rare lipoprotein A